MTQLSVNVNKIATLRNSRGGSIPSVIEAVDVCLDAGAPGITVHPRADERHIRRQDVFEITARLLARAQEGRPHAEFNIEGDPGRPFLDLVLEVRPDQCTLVPVMPGEITSQAGWPPSASTSEMSAIVRDLQDADIRVSLFVDPVDDAVEWAARAGADRIELYTEPFARAFLRGGEAAERSFAAYRGAAELAHARGMGVNAGHDLDLENLRLFRTLPHLDEVSIGHALVSHALLVGLDRSVREYLRAVSG